MHDGELPIDVALVARLLAAQVPALAGRPLRTWPSTGTARLDAGAWARARGYALHQAALIVPYYAASNPAFAAEGARIVGEVVGDVG
jgi:hypothetical protein